MGRFTYCGYFVCHEAVRHLTNGVMLRINYPRFQHVGASIFIFIFIFRMEESLSPRVLEVWSRPAVKRNGVL
jgi:hypothetical protein